MKLPAPHHQTLLIALLLGVLSTPASAALLSGDIAIIGMSTDGPDEFSWVPLIDLQAGETLYFSNAGYDANTARFVAAGNYSEWLLQYTAPDTGLSAGTVQTFIDTNGGTQQENYTGGYALTDFGAIDTSTGNISLASSGDQLLAFTTQDDPSSAAFATQSFTALYSLDSGLGGNEYSFLDNYASYTTDLPPGLTQSETAVALSNAGIDEWDNMRYTGPTTGSRDELLAAISNPDNWEAQNTTVPEGWTAQGIASLSVTPANTSPVPVPVPGSFWLLATGLLGWAARRYRIGLSRRERLPSPQAITSLT